MYLQISLDSPPEDLMNTIAVMGLALGMRHGMDPDHLAAVDGLARTQKDRPR